MTPADTAAQRPHNAKVLVIDKRQDLRQPFRNLPRNHFVDLLRPGDLVVANDAATLPASFQGTHLATGAPLEVRLAGRRSLEPADVSDFQAVVFGKGDFHTRTEHRQPPPPLSPGDRIKLGSLTARITRLVEHPRLVSLHFEGRTDEIWAGIARHGRPIQYAHVPTPLLLWDVWSPIASRPVAFESPSAGFAIDWQTIHRLHTQRIGFVTITHAAGISSTGDDLLDKRLPLDEPYEISEPAARAIATLNASRPRRGSLARRQTQVAPGFPKDDAQVDTGRIIAVGTTVVRALEHAAMPDGTVRPGPGVANQRIGPTSQLRVVDAILTGVHEPGTSHYELLSAFTDDKTLEDAAEWLERHHYRSHEFGDSMFLERRDRQ
jgi:S-adenosylmethionine:tRNA ribosyltransferase-isomerase